MLYRSVFVFPLAILLSVLRTGIFKVFFIEKQVDILNVYTINVITLSKPCTQILTRAISNIVKLYACQVLSTKVITNNGCWIFMDFFKPSPEWDNVTTTAMHIKMTRNKNMSVYD